MHEESCRSSIEQIVKILDELRELKKQHGVNVSMTKHYYFIELLVTHPRFGIRAGRWYRTDQPANDKIFSDIMKTGAHPDFVREGPESRVYRWWAQPVGSRKTDVGPAPLFDTQAKGSRPVAYKISSNGLIALGLHFGEANLTYDN